MVVMFERRAACKLRGAGMRRSIGGRADLETETAEARRRNALDVAHGARLVGVGMLGPLAPFETYPASGLQLVQRLDKLTIVEPARGAQGLEAHAAAACADASEKPKRAAREARDLPIVVVTHGR